MSIRIPERQLWRNIQNESITFATAGPTLQILLLTMVVYDTERPSLFSTRL
jgi:hypothetical protein